jgi:D-alanine-D-alanine ligase
MNKIKVGIIYGGRSTEHEVSLRSAASVFKKLDRTRFEPKTIYIDKNGVWRWVEIPDSFMTSTDASLPIANHAPEVALLSHGILSFQDQKNFGRKEKIDVMMPMLHGKNCEDGTLQGLFESMEIAYTGSGVLGSAIGMDKEISKRLAEHAGLPVVPFRVAYRWNSPEQIETLLQDAEKNLGFPLFIKASREGSSVGVYKVKTREEFKSKLQEAFQFDQKVLIERGIDAREIEYAVLQNSDRSKAPLVSIAAEIIPTHEFYTYDAKYNDENGAIVKVPAEISPLLNEKLTQLVQKIFTSLELEGYSRIDLFLDRKSTAENPVFYLNEVNTLPGFTSISMFPKLWEASGTSYTDLLTKVIELALLRNRG